jgi:tetratricopeptide (TPR) repeat protein
MEEYTSMSSKRRGISASQRTPKSSEKPFTPHSNSTAIQFKRFAPWAMIFCATLAAYLPALQGSPLWDDGGHLTKPALQSLHGLWRIWFELGATQQYYPLLHSAFWFEHRIWGDAMLGYHLTNIVFHALSACLVVLIMRRLSLPGAWLAGFVFALHPVHVESVAWIAEQKSTLSGVFYLAALLVYLRFDQDRQKSNYLLASGLFVLALLSKSVTATLPVVILVIFWWRRGRLDGKRDVRPLLPWFAVGIFSGLFTAWVERTYIGARGAEFLLTPAQRILIAGRVLCFYTGKLFWPVNLMFFYPHWKVDPGVWWQWLFPAVALAVLAGLVLAARRYRGPLASFLIFSATLFPVLGFLNVYPFRYSYVADHFQYLASLGVIVPAIALLAWAIQRTSVRKSVTLAGSVLLILLLGVLTWRQSRMYSDVETLYRASLERNPESWLAHYNLGILLADRPEQLQDAIAEYQAALRLKPDYADAHHNLGIAYSRIPGRLPDAIAEYQAALRIMPDYAGAHNDLGIALSHIPGRQSDAIAEYKAALQANPDLAEAHYNLGNLFARAPEHQQDAIAEYQAALRIDPDYAEAHANLGIQLAAMPGRSSDAIAEFRAALRIKPDFAEVHIYLGNALILIPGGMGDAIAEYREALRIKPDSVEAHFSLGNVLSHIPGSQLEAIAEFQEVQRLRPDLAGIVNQRILALQVPEQP